MTKLPTGNLKKRVFVRAFLRAVVLRLRNLLAAEAASVREDRSVNPFDALHFHGYPSYTSVG